MPNFVPLISYNTSTGETKVGQDADMSLIKQFVDPTFLQNTTNDPTVNTSSSNSDWYAPSADTINVLREKAMQEAQERDTARYSSYEEMGIADYVRQQAIASAQTANGQQTVATSADDIADKLSDQSTQIARNASENNEDTKPPSVYEEVNRLSPQEVKTVNGYIPKGGATNTAVLDEARDAARLKEQQLSGDALSDRLNKEWAKLGTVHDKYLDPLHAQTVEPDPAKINPNPLEPLDHYRGHVYDRPGQTGEYGYEREGDAEYEYEYLDKITGTRKAASRNPDLGFEKQKRADVIDHYVYDPNDTTEGSKTKDVSAYYQTDGQRKFAGSASQLVDELTEKDKKYITDYDLYNFEKDAYGLRDLSPLGPFYRATGYAEGDRFGMDRTAVDVARYANLFSYNRTRQPIADIEWRKGFRYTFITRPECYIMGSDGVQLSLCDQCVGDENFYTSFMRMPQICYLLSPSYVTNSNGDNFNYLLSNRLLGLTPSGTTLDQLQSMQKATNTASVVPGTWVSTDYGGTLNLAFRDTKYLEVYEMLRLWIRYITNIYTGTFASSYSTYGISNNYSDLMHGIRKKIPIGEGWRKYIHPYDRALDYCATIFDIVTNEAGTKILYWCKYVGVYPISAEPGGLANSSNEAITAEQTVNSTFYYQGKVECNSRSLIEFNYNAGIVDECGNFNAKGLTKSMSYLIRDNYYPTASHDRNENYAGPAGLFTGRPYIVLTDESVGVGKFGPNNYRFIPQLRFMQLEDEVANKMNAGITNNVDNNDEFAMSVDEYTPRSDSGSDLINQREYSHLGERSTSSPSDRANQAALDQQARFNQTNPGRDKEPLISAAERAEAYAASMKAANQARNSRN